MCCPPCCPKQSRSLVRSPEGTPKCLIVISPAKSNVNVTLDEQPFQGQSFLKPYKHIPRNNQELPSRSRAIQKSAVRRTHSHRDFPCPEQHPHLCRRPQQKAHCKAIGLLTREVKSHLKNEGALSGSLWPTPAPESNPLQMKLKILPPKICAAPHTGFEHQCKQQDSFSSTLSHL